MKTIESIYNSEKFGKKELRKIKGGLKATNTNNATNIPRRICDGDGDGYGDNGNSEGKGGSGCGLGPIMSTLDSDNDSE
jgi:hypothetical protein